MLWRSCNNRALFLRNNKPQSIRIWRVTKFSGAPTHVLFIGCNIISCNLMWFTLYYNHIWFNMVAVANGLVLLASGHLQPLWLHRRFDAYWSPPICMRFFTSKAIIGFAKQQSAFRPPLTQSTISFMVYVCWNIFLAWICKFKTGNIIWHRKPSYIKMIVKILDEWTTLVQVMA